VITGTGNLSVVSNTSHGPSAFSFDPAGIAGAASTLVTAYPLFYYDNDHETLGSWSSTAFNSVYTQASMYRGMGIIPNSNTLLVWGHHADEACYGNGTDDPELHGTPWNEEYPYCYDLNGVGVEGVHGYPVKYMFWAYDLRDLAEVKAATMSYYQPIPYANWEVTELPIQPSSKMGGGMAVNMSNGDIYVSQYCGYTESTYCWPIIHKFTVSVP